MKTGLPDKNIAGSPHSNKGDMLAMKSINQPKECFGSMGRSIIDGESADNCMSCKAFDKCHKLTIAATLQGIAIDLSLFAENGLASGWLKSFMELNNGSQIKYDA